TSFETVKTALLERAWLEQSGPLKAGQTATLKLALRTYSGETLSESVPIAIPANAPAGTYSLMVADGSTITNVEQREARQAFVPRDLDQLVRAINGLRRNNRIYVRLIRSDEGAIVSGEYMQSLPPSVLAVLGNGDQGRVQSVRMTTLWDADITTDYVFSGSPAEAQPREDAVSSRSGRRAARPGRGPRRARGAAAVLEARGRARLPRGRARGLVGGLRGPRQAGVCV